MADKSKYDVEEIKVSWPAEHVAHVELNRPKKMNSLNMAMWNGLIKTFNLLSRDSNVRVILLSGAGDRAFSAGLDVASDAAASSWGEFPDQARKIWAMRRHIDDCQSSVTALEKCEKPIIGLIHGVCLGGGLTLAMTTDIRLCTPDVRFCCMETNVGLAPDVGTLTRFPKIGVAYSWAKEMTYTGKMFGGEEALRNGFVSRVCADKDDLLKQGLELAKEITTKSPLAVQGSKAIFDFSRDHDVDAGLKYTSSWTAAFADGPDVKAAMQSGLKKTKPTFAKL